VSVARQRALADSASRAVLSFGGVDLPPAMAAPRRTFVKLETDDAERMTKASGPGVVAAERRRSHPAPRQDDDELESGEGLNPDAFINMRHPRNHWRRR
jgi:hypothetical protein